MAALDQVSTSTLVPSAGVDASSPADESAPSVPAAPSCVAAGAPPVTPPEHAVSAAIMSRARTRQSSLRNFMMFSSFVKVSIS